MYNEKPQLQTVKTNIKTQMKTLLKRYRLLKIGENKQPF